MSRGLAKALAIVELRAEARAGLPVTGIAAATDPPASGGHRTLPEPARLGCVRQLQAQGNGFRRMSGR